MSAWDDANWSSPHNQTPTQLPLAYVLEHWRPGSFDRGWAEEFADLGSRQRVGEMVLTWDHTGRVAEGVILHYLRRGMLQPVTLGWDGGPWQGRTWRGRVWAGHHRLWLYHTLAVQQIPVDVVPLGDRRSGEPAHCAPDHGRTD